MLLVVVVSGLVTLGASPALPTTPHLQYHLTIWPPGSIISLSIQKLAEKA